MNQAPNLERTRSPLVLSRSPPNSNQATKGDDVTPDQDREMTFEHDDERLMEMVHRQHNNNNNNRPRHGNANNNGARGKRLSVRELVGRFSSFNSNAS